MRYFKEYDESGNLIAIGAGDALNGETISQEEYEALLAEIEAKWAVEAEAANKAAEEAEQQEKEAIAEAAAEEALAILTGVIE